MRNKPRPPGRGEYQISFKLRYLKTQYLNITMPTDSNHHAKPDKTKQSTAVRLIPFIVGCALFMQMLDSSVVAMALPIMADTFNTMAVRMNIAITAYLVAVAIFVPVCGWAADRFGAKKIFLFAIILFCLSSLGGFIVTFTSWHWIFLINIPMGMLGIFMVLKYIQEYKKENPPSLDWPGFILSGLAMASCVYGFESLAKNQGFINAYFLLAISLISGILYRFHAKRVANPIIDLSLLKIQSFAISIIAGNLCRFAVGSTPFLLALLLQIGFNYTPLSAGIITFSGALGVLAMKFVAIPILKRFGFRRVLTVNAVITGLFIMACA